MSNEEEFGGLTVTGETIEAWKTRISILDKSIQADQWECAELRQKVGAANVLLKAMEHRPCTGCNSIPCICDELCSHASAPAHGEKA